MSDDILIENRIVHELVRQIGSFIPRDTLDPGVECSGRIMRSLVVLGEPVGRV